MSDEEKKREEAKVIADAISKLPDNATPWNLPKPIKDWLGDNMLVISLDIDCKQCKSEGLVCNHFIPLRDSISLKEDGTPWRVPINKDDPDQNFFDPNKINERV